MKRTFKDFPESLNSLSQDDLDYLYNYAYKRVGQDAMDAVHTALINYSKNPIQPNKGATLKTFLVKQVDWACSNILYQRGVDWHRHITCDEIPDIPLEEVAPYIKIDLLENVNKLHEKYRIIITKLYYEGYTQEELGTELRVSTTRINQLHKEAIDILRVYLKDYDRGV